MKPVVLSSKWWEVERKAEPGTTLVVRRTRRKSAASSRMLKAREVADIMGCSIQKVYDRINDKSLYAEWDGGQYRIPDYALDDYYDYQRSKKKA
jgi:excisionase family DNA binding protein